MVDQKSQKNLEIVPLIILLTIFFILCLFSIRQKSVTYDEPAHYQYGLNILHGNPSRYHNHDLQYWAFNSKMPISALNALPERLAEILPPGTIQNLLLFNQAKRIPTMFFGVITGLFLFKFTKELYGQLAGFLSLFLYTFEPNIIAHSRLVTTDIYAAGMIMIAIYYFWRFNKARTWKNAIISAAALAIAQLSKYTGAYLYPLFFILYLMADSEWISNTIRNRDMGKIGRYFIKSAGFILVFILITLLVLNLGFMFDRTLAPLAEYEFKSDPFIKLQSLPVVNQIPIPIPTPFLEGLDWVSHDNVHGSSFGNVYYFGNLKPDGERVLGYFFGAMLLKMPIPTLLLVIAAFILYIKNDSKKTYFQNENFLFIPILFFLIYFNFFFYTQIGIRFILVIFPLLFIFAGSLVKNWQVNDNAKKIGIIALLAYLVISNLSYFPHYISYFNEFVWRRENAYKYLADSNLDWGQNEFLVETYLSDHPDARYKKPRPQAGTFIVSANDLAGISAYPERLAWLREHFEPDGTIGYSHLIYHIDNEDLKRIPQKYFDLYEIEK